jgi:5-methylcytosine-specific restriction endonuclease McrA
VANKGGPKKAAYDKAYNARPEQVKKRTMRNQARRQYEQQHGDLPSDVDVNHKKPLDRGTQGANSGSNLEASSQKKNRGWRKGKSGSGSYNP